MSAQEQKTGRWKAFTSLAWYDGTIEFLFRFVAKTSEPLLAAGIVYSAADVLSKGHLGSSNPVMDNLWAISQALAIESSGGVVLVYGLQSLKEKDYVKAWLYFILSALLAITGGVMLYMQLAGLENQQADSLLMRGLFALRCVVSVGYIYLCRTKAISFRNLDGEKPIAPAPVPVVPQDQQPASIDYQRLAQELAPLLQAVRTTIIEEVKASITGPQSPLCLDQPERGEHAQPSTLLLDSGEKQQPVKVTQEPGRATSAKLEAAYQELLQANPGQRVSGRALARQAHIDRQTCASWLKTTHPEHVSQPGSSTTAKKTASRARSRVTTTATGSPPVEIAEAQERTAITETLPVVTATSQRQPEETATATISEPRSEEIVAANQPDMTATASQSQPGETAIANW